MIASIISGLVVSIDAFFIGLSLGMQKNCKFIYLVIINIFLFGLCVLGFLIAGQIYESIPFEPDYVVGAAFLALGFWTILHYFLSEYFKRGKGLINKTTASPKTIIFVGIVMSAEAMLITMGITFIFQSDSTLLIPIIVSFAHFGYSSLSFFLARTKHIKRIPIALSHLISGLALILYGLMAIFVEFGI